METGNRRLENRPESREAKDFVNHKIKLESSIVVGEEQVRVDLDTVVVIEPGVDGFVYMKIRDRGVGHVGLLVSESQVLEGRVLKAYENDDERMDDGIIETYLGYYESTNDKTLPIMANLLFKTVEEMLEHLEQRTPEAMMFAASERREGVWFREVVESMSRRGSAKDSKQDTFITRVIESLPEIDGVKNGKAKDFVNCKIKLESSIVVGEDQVRVDLNAVVVIEPGVDGVVNVKMGGLEGGYVNFPVSESQVLRGRVLKVYENDDERMNDDMIEFFLQLYKNGKDNGLPLLARSRFGTVEKMLEHLEQRTPEAMSFVEAQRLELEMMKVCMDACSKLGKKFRECYQSALGKK